MVPGWRRCQRGRPGDRFLQVPAGRDERQFFPTWRYGVLRGRPGAALIPTRATAAVRPRPPTSRGSLSPCPASPPPPAWPGPMKHPPTPRRLTSRSVRGHRGEAGRPRRITSRSLRHGSGAAGRGPTASTPRRRPGTTRCPADATAQVGDQGGPHTWRYDAPRSPRPTPGLEPGAVEVHVRLRLTFARARSRVLAVPARR